MFVNPKPAISLQNTYLLNESSLRTNILESFNLRNGSVFLYLKTEYSLKSIDD
ncbi:Hypothetical predicted protein [Pelobates cultripes]|uniref:Uncharacterized protein n=1 Tax=Pelobates cultripes TaxID=61616 RepID=A0AAD1WJ82_PELCU|nr:Hypothetical predicted protein [Pelobates cultripes]